MRTLLFFILVLLFACSDGKRSIRDYYFPVHSLQNGQVYAYVSEAGDTTDRRYWLYRSFERDSGLFMTGIQYDRDFNIVQVLREKIVDNGSLARNSTLYDTDTAGGPPRSIPALIESPNLFPFKVSDSLGVFLFHLKYHPLSDPAATIYIIRNRRYLGEGPGFELNGRKYPTLRFGLEEVVGNEKEGASEVEGRGEEWYAKGLGLVYYRKSFGGDKIRYAYRLAEILSPAVLEQRAGRQLGADPVLR